MKKVVISAAFLGCLFTVSASTFADDWLQFRGPGGSSVSDEKGLPISWSEKENLRWKVALPGRGLSCPVIVGDHVLVTACSGYRQSRLHILCYKASDGSKLWERQFTATGNTACNNKTSMAAPTPVSDGKAVYCLFATGDLAALTLEGDLMWYRSLVRDYPDITNQVGMASSPVLHKNVLLLPMENAGESFAAGIDTKTGKNLWKVERARQINWTTPVVITHDKQTSAIFQTAGEVTAFEPETGKILWNLEGKGGSSIPSPIYADGLLYIPGGNFVAVRPTTDGTTPEVVWKSNKLGSSYASPVFYQGRIYALIGIGLNCVDGKTGTLIWQQRLKGPWSATPVMADGKAYIVNEAGSVVVLELGAEEAKILATNEMSEMILATPSIANGAIYLRSDKHLYCVGAKK